MVRKILIYTGKYSSKKDALQAETYLVCNKKNIPDPIYLCLFYVYSFPKWGKEAAKIHMDFMYIQSNPQLYCQVSPS